MVTVPSTYYVATSIRALQVKRQYHPAQVMNLFVNRHRALDSEPRSVDMEHCHFEQRVGGCGRVVGGRVHWYG